MELLNVRGRARDNQIIARVRQLSLKPARDKTDTPAPTTLYSADLHDELRSNQIIESSQRLLLVAVPRD